jgi:hypothetical protein
VRQRLAASPACPAPMTTVVTCSMVDSAAAAGRR